jgi:hypothetical protein
MPAPDATDTSGSATASTASVATAVTATAATATANSLPHRRHERRPETARAGSRLRGNPEPQHGRGRSLGWSNYKNGWNHPRLDKAHPYSGLKDETVRRQAEGLRSSRFRYRVTPTVQNTSEGATEYSQTQNTFMAS